MNGAVMATRWERYERKYRALAAQLAKAGEAGFISPGTVVVRETSCGKAGCRCQADPPQRHGPYYQWTRAIAGKTVTKRLTAEQADLYRTWIANRRAIETIIDQMEQLSADAAELLLNQAQPRKLDRKPARS